MRASATNWKTWGRIGAGFCAATLAQLLLYAGPSHLANGRQWLPGPLYTPYVLFFRVGPAICAGALAFYSLKRRATTLGQKQIGLKSLAAVIALALLSAYLGVFIAINTWGT